LKFLVQVHTCTKRWVELFSSHTHMGSKLFSLRLKKNWFLVHSFWFIVLTFSFSLSHTHTQKFLIKNIMVFGLKHTHTRFWWRTCKSLLIFGSTCARTHTPISSLKQTKELFGYGSLTHIHVFWFLVEHTKALVLG